MLVNFKSTWEKRDEADKQLPQHFLTENQRWNNEKKLYTVRVFSIKQAKRILNARCARLKKQTPCTC